MPKVQASQANPQDNQVQGNEGHRARHDAHEKNKGVATRNGPTRRESPASHRLIISASLPNGTLQRSFLRERPYQTKAGSKTVSFWWWDVTFFLRFRWGGGVGGGSLGVVDDGVNALRDCAGESEGALDTRSCGDESDEHGDHEEGDGRA